MICKAQKQYFSEEMRWIDQFTHSNMVLPGEGSYLGRENGFDISSLIPLQKEISH